MKARDIALIVLFVLSVALQAATFGLRLAANIELENVLAQVRATDAMTRAELCR